MATAATMLQKIQIAATEKPGSHYWLDRVEKLDLLKLKTSELTALGIDTTTAHKVLQSLHKADFSELGKALGIDIRIKFRVWADREPGKCKIRGEEPDNVEWLKSYLTERLPEIRPTETTLIKDTPALRFDIPLSETVKPLDLQTALRDCEAILLMRDLALKFSEQPHVTIEAHNLATWIKDQSDYWWSVDGDPILTGQLELPCPSDDMAVALNKFNKKLLVFDPQGTGCGEEITAEEVNEYLVSDKGFGQLVLSWDESSVGWELIRDKPIDI